FFNPDTFSILCFFFYRSRDLQDLPSFPTRRSSDLVVAKKDSEFFQRIRAIQYSGGAVPSPFDCWLVLRGMRTLPWRMRAHSENRSEEHTSELQSRFDLVCRLLLEKKKL